MLPSLHNNEVPLQKLQWPAKCDNMLSIWGMAAPLPQLCIVQLHTTLADSLILGFPR